MLKLAAAIMAVGALASPTIAQDSIYQMQTGNHLYALCTSQDVVDQARCINWVMGFSDGITVGAIMAERQLVCFPADSTIGQNVDVIVTYLRQHPEVRHQPMAYLAYAALARAFPCAPAISN